MDLLHPRYYQSIHHQNRYHHNYHDFYHESINLQDLQGCNVLHQRGYQPTVSLPALTERLHPPPVNLRNNDINPVRLVRPFKQICLQASKIALPVSQASIISLLYQHHQQ